MNARYILIPIFMLHASTSGAAQTEAPSPPPESEDAEEIVVTGERATMQLRLQMFEAEKSAYELFNRFNDERRFDISCAIQERTGSRFERQVCQPEFALQAERAHAQDYYETIPSLDRPSNGNLVPTRPPMEFEISRQMSAFRRRMREVAEQEPEFLEAIVRYTQLQQQYRERTGQAQITAPEAP